MSDSKQRFSITVEHYDRYRPSYPVDLIRVLEGKRLLPPAGTVADVGSGTGILSRLFVDRGYRVLGVEPNGDMREAAERVLGDTETFYSVEGSAEATTLDDDSVDLVVAGQAFHWFEPLATREEFRRILRHDGIVALVWNDRRNDANAFMAAYLDLLDEHGTDFRRTSHQRRGREAVEAFFGGGEFRVVTLNNSQVLDLDGLKGRVLSCSYVPHEGEPGYEAMIEACDALFERHNTNDRVVLEYHARMYYGRPE